MKYCSNCKANKESWAEKLKDYDKYSDDKCWECDKYTLGNLVEYKCELKPMIVEKKIGCNMRGGSWCETTYFNPGDGSTARTYIKSGNWKAESQMVIEVPPKQSCKIL